jgi:hypothetical protein
MRKLRYAPHVLLMAALGACTFSGSLDGYQRGGPAIGRDATFEDVQSRRDTSLADGGDPDAVGGDADICDISASIPQKPMGTDTGDIAFTVAVKSFVTALHPADASKPNGIDLSRVGGFNLDGVRTDPGEAACSIGGAPALVRDGCGGIDNTLTKLVDTLRSVTARQDFFDPAEEINSGKSTLLLYVKGWNGTDNDPFVTVGAFSGVGIEQTSDGNTRPNFNGADKWLLDAASVAGTATPPESRDEVRDAYVRDGFLVARINFQLRFGGPGVATKDSRIVARIVKSTKSPQNYVLADALVAGRLTTQALLTNFQYTNDTIGPDKTAYLCKGNGTYDTLKEKICEARDIGANPTQDRLSSTACDAISYAIGFTTETALAGKSLERAPLPSPCIGGVNYSDDCK